MNETTSRELLMTRRRKSTNNLTAIFHILLDRKIPKRLNFIFFNSFTETEAESLIRKSNEKHSKRKFKLKKFAFRTCFFRDGDDKVRRNRTLQYTKGYIHSGRCICSN